MPATIRVGQRTEGFRPVFWSVTLIRSALGALRGAGRPTAAAVAVAAAPNPPFLAERVALDDGHPDRMPDIEPTASAPTPAVPDADRTGSAAEAAAPIQSSTRRYVRGAFATILFCLTLWIAWPFLPAVAWAVVIVVSAWPLYARVERVFSDEGPSTAAAMLFTAGVALLVFVPIVLAVQQIVAFQEPLQQWLNQAREHGIPTPSWLGQVPGAGAYISQLWQTNLADPKAVAALLAGIPTDGSAGWMQGFGGNLLHRIVLFAFALIITFCLFRQGRWAAERVIETVDKLMGRPGQGLARKMIPAVRGSVNGTLVVAVGEGLLIGLGYVLAGVPQPLVFGLLTTACAMLPFGAWIAFSAAALLCAVQTGSQFAGAAVFLWGAFVMLIGDHFVWPKVVGTAARLPFVVALVGIFGGIQAFGLVGLFLGPVAMAAVLTVWREWLEVQ